MQSYKSFGFDRLETAPLALRRKLRSHFSNKQLNQTLKFLLTNSVCESLEGETGQQARAELVKLIVTLDIGEGHLSNVVKKQK